MTALNSNGIIVPVRVDPAATVTVESDGTERMVLVARAAVNPSDSTNIPDSFKLYLVEHARDPGNPFLWSGHASAEPIRERTYQCVDHDGDGGTPPDCSIVEPHGLINPSSNLSLVYITEDHLPDSAGRLERFPGRLMLSYLDPRNLPHVAYSAPGNYFDLWMRSGFASNTGLEIVAAGEPGERAAFPLFAEPGVDANPRATFKFFKGMINLWPFADGIRDVPQYDHNDWPIIRWGFCLHLVTHRCPAVLGDPLCLEEDQKALRLRECGELERPGAPPLTHYPLTVKP